MMSKQPEGRVKVSFTFQKDDVGWPPVDTESLWAVDLGQNRYQLDNTPFFARGVSWKDIVSAKVMDGKLVFEKVLEHSGHSTLRVFSESSETRDFLCKKLRELGCSFEGIPQYKMVAFDVPPAADLDGVRSFLSQGEAAGKWAYEEGLLAR